MLSRVGSVVLTPIYGSRFASLADSGGRINLSFIVDRGRREDVVEWIGGNKVDLGKAERGRVWWRERLEDIEERMKEEEVRLTVQISK